MFKTFHEALDEKIIIPRVYPQYSTRRVLTLSLEQGKSIETASTRRRMSVINLADARPRARQEIFYLKRFHCDPHPGNFAFREDGHVIVYDYGGVKTLNTEIIEHFKTLINAARQHDIDTLEDQLITLNALSEKGKFPKELYEEWLDVLLRPLTTQYDFAENSAHHDGVLLVKKSLKYWDLFKPSPDTLMVNRTISGHYWNLIQLKVNDDLSDLFEELVASDQQDKL